MKRPKIVPPWLVPKPLRSGELLRSRSIILRHFLKNYGWLRSFREGRCVNQDGLPIPWFTYPAIDFLSQLDLSDRTVFEYGSGASTLFWSTRARHVISVESEPDWFERVVNSAPANVEMLLVSREIEEYAGAIRGRGQFDVIVVDGTGESRDLCCEMALKHIRPGGIVIFDDSDTWLRCAALLRNSGLIQADFTGFAPLIVTAKCTSVFFTREYDMAPIDGYQPHASVAQPAKPWP
ncbi:class I SAM-dependent methyltransferase [Pseudomonadota bacterium]